MKVFSKILIKSQILMTSILYLCLVVSLVTLVIYFMELNYDDNFLYFLLIIIRYSSFILCICSLYKLLVNIFHFFRRPSVLRAMKNLLYLLLLLYSIIIILFESFIVVVSGGN
jgi:hypothetical protein